MAGVKLLMLERDPPQRAELSHKNARAQVQVPFVARAGVNEQQLEAAQSAQTTAMSTGSHAFQRRQTATSISPVSMSKGSAMPIGLSASGE